MRVLLTLGPTYEAIDPVRFIGNRSSGRMGAALAGATLEAGHELTMIAGPVSVGLPARARRIDVESSEQMHRAVMLEFPGHDLLLMSAAVADYRPRRVSQEKIGREGMLTIECEPTEDIVALAARMRRDDQRVVAFSLESAGNLQRAREKLSRKRLDLLVFNPIETMNSTDVAAVLLWPDGRNEELPRLSKEQFARVLLERTAGLFA